jgi:hypothetical protein
MRTLTRRHDSEPATEPARPDTPPGFKPLNAYVRLEILGRIGRSMTFEVGPFARTSPDLTFTFRPDGRMASSDLEHPIDRAKTITVTVAAGWPLPRRQPGPHGEDGSINFVELAPEATRSQLDQWCVDDDGNCWRPGLPLPVRSPAEQEWPPLASATVTAIKRAHAEANPMIHDSLGRPVGASFMCAYDATTGVRRGTSLDLEIADHQDHFVMVSARAHPDDLDLAKVHVDPITGTVRPRPVPLLPGVA